MSRHFESLSRLKEIKISDEFCRNKEFLCCDKHSSICQDQDKFYVTAEENYVAMQHSGQIMGDKKTLSRQRSFMSQQTQHEDEVNFFTTKTNIVAKEVEKITKRMLQHRNSCCDRIKN